MKKILTTLAAVLCIMTTAIAQTGRYTQGGYSVYFQKLPPLKADFDISLTGHHQSNLLQTSLQNPQEKDSSANQSIMLRHEDNNAPIQYHYKRPKYMMTGDGDGFKDIRDYIVRERREKEGRPLQPLSPGFFRR
jgi:hypothetical protein